MALQIQQVPSTHQQIGCPLKLGQAIPRLPGAAVQPATSQQARRIVFTCAQKAQSLVKSQPVRTVSQAPIPVPPEVQTYTVAAGTAYAAILFLSMMLLPRVAAIRKAMQSYWPFAPLAVAYLVLLALSWTPDTISTLLPGSLAEGLTGFKPQFFPRLDGISALFSQPATAASWVLHIVVINLFLGRSIYIDGLSKGVPTTHSLLVASIFGPLGLLLHWITKAFIGVVPGLNPDRRERVLKTGDGSITILPYDT